LKSLRVHQNKIFIGVSYRLHDLPSTTCYYHNYWSSDLPSITSWYHNNYRSPNFPNIICYQLPTIWIFHFKSSNILTIKKNQINLILLLSIWDFDTPRKKLIKVRKIKVNNILLGSQLLPYIYPFQKKTDLNWARNHEGCLLEYHINS